MGFTTFSWTRQGYLRLLGGDRRRMFRILSATAVGALVLTLAPATARGAGSPHHTRSVAYDTAQVRAFARAANARLSGFPIFGTAEAAAEVRAVSAAATGVPGLRAVDLGGRSACVGLDGYYFIVSLTAAPSLQSFASATALWAWQNPYDWRGAQLFASEVRDRIYGGLSRAAALTQVMQSAPLTDGLEFLAGARFTAKRSLTITMHDGAVYKASWAAPHGWDMVKWPIIHPHRVDSPHGI